MSELKQALENLKSFSQLLDKSPSSSYNSILSSSYRIVGLFSSRDKSRFDLIDQVCQSSDVVKKYFPLIHLLEEGDSDQQKLALDVKDIVERFNNTIERITKVPLDWGSRIARFLYSRGGMFIGERLAKIELPTRAAVQINFPFPSANALPAKLKCQWQYQGGGSAAQKISELCHSAMPLTTPPSQTLELYLMKMISLLVKSELLMNSEAREIVRNTPFQMSLDKDRQILTISQMLEPIPGQIIKVGGGFKRDSRSSLHTIFLPEECEFSTHSVQTGFPHPLQRHGFALSDALMPINFAASEKSSEFSSLYALKKKVALDLLPGGNLAPKARQLIRMKKQAFEADRSLFLRLHEKQTLAICNLNKASNLSQAVTIAKNFFELVNIHPHAYEFLSEINHQILQSCAKIPQDALLQAHAANKLGDFKREFHPKLILTSTYEQSIKRAAESQAEKQASEYIHMMGSILFLSVKQLILQNYSEIASFKAQTLDKPAKALEGVLYRQLKDFHHELAVSTNQIDMSLRMQTLLHEETGHFLCKT